MSMVNPIMRMVRVSIVPDTCGHAIVIVTMSMSMTVVMSTVVTMSPYLKFLLKLCIIIMEISIKNFRDWRLMFSYFLELVTMMMSETSLRFCFIFGISAINSMTMTIVPMTMSVAVVTMSMTIVAVAIVTMTVKIICSRSVIVVIVFRLFRFLGNISPISDKIIVMSWMNRIFWEGLL